LSCSFLFASLRIKPLEIQLVLDDQLVWAPVAAPDRDTVEGPDLEADSAMDCPAAWSQI
jgi:hypothetical protein